MYVNTKTNSGHVMPLLMGVTTPTPIAEESAIQTILYDPVAQRTIMDFATIGTKSLKITGTGSGSNARTDKKNEIDDKKNV